MKVLMNVCVLGCFLLFVCKDAGTDSPLQTSGFAIYRLRDSSTTAVQAWSMPLESLPLAYEPLLTSKDITVYHWSTHAFVAQPRIDTLFAMMGRMTGQSGDIPFVVVVNSERVYLGAFGWWYSSMICQVPYIAMHGSTSSYSIGREPLASLPDKRGDMRIHNALRAAGVLVE